MPNPCNVCRWRWTPEQQKSEGGHCYYWREEPSPCPRHVFQLDEWAFVRDMVKQITEGGHEI